MSALKDQIATIMAIVKTVYVIVMIHILEILASSSCHAHLLPLKKPIHLTQRMEYSGSGNKRIQSETLDTGFTIARCISKRA
mmetsp:Transcript_42922/g.77195  ORF Transcript_42922/g.77195 Transcript_42922/m.77195 type:complete len:82 (+) Transcript_42922:1679-1924(+)